MISPPICLTVDLHHSSLQTGNQRACDITEIQVARKFLELLEEKNVPATFFITGRCFEQEWHDLRPICEHPLISVQGHGYHCFEPPLFYRAWKKLTGNYNGPSFWERRDIRRTINIIESYTGTTPTCWRNHMYMHGPNTSRLLSEQGIRLVSDGVTRATHQPEINSDGLWNFPINIIPDHEHLYHAERTPEWVAWWVNRYKWSDDFGPHSYYIEDWTDIAIQCLDANEKRKAVSNLIIHPITMYLCDGFVGFRRLLDHIAKRSTTTLDRLVDSMEGATL